MLRRAVAVALASGALLVPAVPGHAETREPLTTFVPLPAAPAVPADVRAVRDELLGDRWDDPGAVTLHWTGVSSFVITIGGHLLLFDAWEIIGAVDDYLPLGREELAALDPEAVLVGHGHFDHAGDLGYVAGRSGAVVVGSEEICTVAVEGAQREGVGTDFRCAITGTAISPAPGTAQSLTLFADLPPVTVLQHVHSAARPPSEENELDPFFPVMDVEPYLTHLADDPE
ncbi:MAG TPA: MBL fold metallo-hydrolase, partial [Mycobacteriales bacterium]|nr:MBL fold metallo-hydrolase [Mycobacteriales bacterium]